MPSGQRFHKTRARLGIVLLMLGLAWMALLSACTPESNAELSIYGGINSIRTGAGLPALTPDASLVQIARARSDDMATHHYLGHMPPDGCDYVCLMDRHGVARAYAGETISFNTFDWSRTTTAAVEGWKASPAHLARMLDCHYQRVGSGVAEAADGTIYFTAIFEGAVDC